MKILLDTHILLWIHTDSVNLSPKARKILSDSNNDVYFSPVNIWETQIKHLNHPKEFQISGEELFELSLQANMKFIPITPNHAIELKSLCYDGENAPRIHKDPFDKILISQAKSENMILMTHDELIPFYNEACILSV